MSEVIISGYDGVFATRLRKLMEENHTTQKELASYTKITRQAISQYMDGSVLPNIEKFYKIMNFFKVSADYLLGVSDVKSFDLDIKAISEKTGLSERAIRKINQFRNEKSNYINHEFRIEIINNLFKEYYFYSLIDKIIKFIEVKTELDETKEHIFRKYCVSKGVEYDKLSFDYRDSEFVTIESDFNDFYKYFDMKLGEVSKKDIGYQEYMVMETFGKLLDDIKYDYREIILNDKQFSKELKSKLEILDRVFEHNLKVFEEEGPTAIVDFKSKELGEKLNKMLTNENMDN